jgi:predicted nucleic acid-binding protein
MSARYFLDTNVFVSVFTPTAAAKSRRANELVRDALSTGRGVISYQVAQEFVNVALHGFVRPLSTADIEQYLTTVLRPMIAVHSSPALFLQALHLRSQYQLPWQDSLILAAAIQAQCQILYSEDFQTDRRFGNLRVENLLKGSPS